MPLMPGRRPSRGVIGSARTSKVRRSKSPVARVARQVANWPWALITVTRSGICASCIAGTVTVNSSPTLSPARRSSRRLKVNQTSSRSTIENSGAPTPKFSPSSAILVVTWPRIWGVDRQLGLIGPPLLYGRFGLLHVGGGDRLLGDGVADRQLQPGVRGFALADGCFQIARGLVETSLRRVASARERGLARMRPPGQSDFGVGRRELGFARGDDLGPGVVDLLQIRLSRHQRRLGDRQGRLELRALQPGDDRAVPDCVADIRHELVDPTGHSGTDVGTGGVHLALDRQWRRPGREPKRRADGDHDRNGGKYSSEPATRHGGK
jgi:hypothetical protein